METRNSRTSCRRRRTEAKWNPFSIIALPRDPLKYFKRLRFSHRVLFLFFPFFSNVLPPRGIRLQTHDTTIRYRGVSLYGRSDSPKLFEFLRYRTRWSKSCISCCRVVSICFMENFYSGAEDLLSNISIHRLLYIKNDLPVAKKFSIVSAPEIKQMYWAISFLESFRF